MKKKKKKIPTTRLAYLNNVRSYFHSFLNHPDSSITSKDPRVHMVHPQWPSDPPPRSILLQFPAWMIGVWTEVIPRRQMTLTMTLTMTSEWPWPFLQFITLQTQTGGLLGSRVPGTFLRISWIQKLEENSSWRPAVNKKDVIFVFLRSRKLNPMKCCCLWRCLHHKCQRWSNSMKISLRSEFLWK